jgi:hypothetical protein
LLLLQFTGRAAGPAGSLCATTSARESSLCHSERGGRFHFFAGSQFSGSLRGFRLQFHLVDVLMWNLRAVIGAPEQCNLSAKPFCYMVPGVGFERRDLQALCGACISAGAPQAMNFESCVEFFNMTGCGGISQIKLLRVVELGRGMSSASTALVLSVDK